MTRKFIFRSILYVFIFLIILVAGIQLSFTFYFNNKIKSELEAALSEQTKGEYEIVIGDLGTNIFTQSVYISQFLLKPDKNSDPTAPKYFVSASEINFQHFGVISFLLRKDLKISGIELKNPSAYIYRNSNRTKKKSTQKKERFSIYNLIKKSIHSIKINGIEIKNADFRIYDDYRDSVPSMVSNDNELIVANFRINQSVEDSGKLFKADKVRMQINKFSYTTKDSLYSVNVKKLTASYTDATLILDSAEVVPNYSKRNFAHEAGKQTDRMKIAAERLSFRNMNVKLFFERNWFIAEDLNIDNLNVAAYRDKNDSRIPDRPKSVQALLKSIPIYAVIDSIHLRGSEITYEEVAEGAVNPGKITFNKVAATITGFTSDTTLFSKYKILVVDARGYFMGKGKLSARYVFPLNTDEMVFDCSGKLQELPFTAINPMMEPNASVSMKEGEIDSMIFSFHANDKMAKGKMKFVYHNLKLELLNRKNHKAGVVENVLSYLVQKLIIKDSNPSSKESVRITEINNPRNPGRFIFNYTWKSILSGIKPAVGLPESLGKPGNK